MKKDQTNCLLQFIWSFGQCKKIDIAKFLFSNNSNIQKKYSLAQLGRHMFHAIIRSNKRSNFLVKGIWEPLKASAATGNRTRIAGVGVLCSIHYTTAAIAENRFCMLKNVNIRLSSCQCTFYHYLIRFLSLLDTYLSLSDMYLPESDTHFTST